jgi:hypothetical protein
MGQFTDAGSIMTSRHRICSKDLNVLGAWGFTGNDPPLVGRHLPSVMVSVTEQVTLTACSWLRQVSLLQLN